MKSFRDIYIPTECDTGERPTGHIGPFMGKGESVGGSVVWGWGWDLGGGGRAPWKFS